MKPLMGFLAAALTSLLFASSVEAQEFVEYGPITRAGSAYYFVPEYPYSYWAATPFPARGYVGPSEFAYHGRPYGHPYDPWTWPYMSADHGVLARYYYPPVR